MDNIAWHLDPLLDEHSLVWQQLCKVFSNSGTSLIDAFSGT